MLITTSPNGTKKDEDFISFHPESIVDGMKIGIIREKMKTNGLPVKLDFHKDEIKSLSILKSHLVDLLC